MEALHLLRYTTFGSMTLFVRTNLPGSDKNCSHEKSTSKEWIQKASWHSDEPLVSQSTTYVGTIACSTLGVTVDTNRIGSDMVCGMVYTIHVGVERMPLTTLTGARYLTSSFPRYGVWYHNMVWYGTIRTTTTIYEVRIKYIM